MKTTMKPEELFEGALICQHDQDTYAAVIIKLHGDLVDVVDVTTWSETVNQPVTGLSPACLNDGFPLRRMGFLRDVSSVNPQYKLEILNGTLTVFQRGESWTLTDGDQSVQVTAAHQVQAESKRLFGHTILIAPLGVDQQEEEDYYLE